MKHATFEHELTREQIRKVVAMGQPYGWWRLSGVEIDTEYSIFQRKQRRIAHVFTAFAVAGALLSAWGYAR